MNPKKLIRFSDWYEARGIPRSTAWELLKAKKLETKVKPLPGTRTRAAFITAAAAEVLDALVPTHQQPREERRSIEQLERENAALRAVLKELLNNR